VSLVPDDSRLVQQDLFALRRLDGVSVSDLSRVVLVPVETGDTGEGIRDRNHA